MPTVRAYPIRCEKHGSGVLQISATVRPGKDRRAILIQERDWDVPLATSVCTAATLSIQIGAKNANIHLQTGVFNASMVFSARA
jgi:hypothetical protein